ncbi:enoyl-CoA hydratase-related protein [Nocardioides solisilvae]|uniref:enoyl-CoA hydratase-related protein n=1 Tax=Nocardioides solisilvae TaxID=1542435 RepID=UPI001EF5D9E2|nr:enoyl-CoA hydratase-related protein [Nocardioides solisilvae]
MADLRVSCESGVLRMVMDRPAVRNALTAAMVDEMTAQLEALPGRDDVRVVLLAGAGGAFSSGADLSDQAGQPAQDGLDVSAMDRANRLVRAVVRADQPVVSAVDGVAAGFGCALALACDLVVAAPTSSFVLSFARVGLMPDGGTTATVAAAVGRARAMRMALLGDPLGGAEAHAAGLVSHLAAEGDLDAEVERLVARLAAGAPLAQAATKRAVNAATLDLLEPALETERRHQSLLLRTDDVAEGVLAFVEKRPARFLGR